MAGAGLLYIEFDVGKSLVLPLDNREMFQGHPEQACAEIAVEGPVLCLINEKYFGCSLISLLRSQLAPKAKSYTSILSVWVAIYNRRYNVLPFLLLVVAAVTNRHFLWPVIAG